MIMEEFLNLNISDSNDDSIVTPESMAWKLLMDEDVKDYAGILMPNILDCQLPMLDEINDNEENIDTDSPHTNYDRYADQFQILITMYMEMVFGLLKINHITSHIDANCEDADIEVDLKDTFKPDFTKFTIEDMQSIFRDKFKKIRVFLNVGEIFDTDPINPRDYGSDSEYYCRIILKDTPEGKTYFWNNRNNPFVDSEKSYTFVIRNDAKKSSKKLDDFYAVCVLPNVKVRIGFSNINIIVPNQHLV